jgi:hypothetical protein
VDVNPVRSSRQPPRLKGRSMRTRSLITATTAVGLVSLGAALPAQAATSGSTTATMTIPSGVLSISVSPSAGELDYLSDASGQTVSGLLGQVQVIDARNAPAGSGWTASVASTPFGSASGAQVPASAISYRVGPIDQTGIASYTADDPSGLASAVPAVTASGVSGNNTATWNPRIIVAIPSGMTAGSYSATITHSVD